MRKIWIIRFSDGTIGSCYGTRSGAAEIAELRKEDYGESYTIEGEEDMTEKQVSRYIDLVRRRIYILAHSGVDWKPEYGLEMEQIDRELEKLRPLVEKLRSKTA